MSDQPIGNTFEERLELGATLATTRCEVGEAWERRLDGADPNLGGAAQLVLRVPAAIASGLLRDSFGIVVTDPSIRECLQRQADEQLAEEMEDARNQPSDVSVGVDDEIVFEKPFPPLPVAHPGGITFDNTEWAAKIREGVAEFNRVGAETIETAGGVIQAIESIPDTVKTAQDGYKGAIETVGATVDGVQSAHQAFTGAVDFLASLGVDSTETTPIITGEAALMEGHSVIPKAKPIPRSS